MDFGQKAVLFLHVTSHVREDPYQDLLREKGGTGFPYLAVLDEDGNVLVKHQGDRTVAGFEATVAKTTRYVELKKQAESGDDSGAADYLVARIEMRLLDPRKAKAEQRKLKDPTPEQAAAIEAGLLDLEVYDALSEIRSAKDNADAGATFYQMMRKKRVPTGEMAPVFWEKITYYAERKKNKKLFAEAMEAFAAAAPEGRQRDGALQSMAERLRKLGG